MPDACVVAGCNNVPNKEGGIALCPIPFYGKDDPLKQRRRKKWVHGDAYWTNERQFSAKAEKGCDWSLCLPDETRS